MCYCSDVQWQHHHTNNWNHFLAPGDLLECGWCFCLGADPIKVMAPESSHGRSFPQTGPHFRQKRGPQRQAGARAQGKDAVRFLEGLVVGDIQGIQNGSGSLSMFTNENGGIVDDTVVTKARTSRAPQPPPPPPPSEI